MNVKQALLVGAILALPATAAAQPISGLYIGAGAGATLPFAEPNKGFGLPDGTQLGLKNGAHFDAGWLGEVSVGYGLGNGLRAEIEGDFYRNQLGNFSASGPSNGFENKYGAMVNVLYDFSFQQLGLAAIDFVQPYVGVGAGYQFTRWNGVYSGPPGAQLSVNNKGANGFAYQGIIGLAVPMQSVPGLAFTLEYRAMDMPFNRKYSAGFTTPAGVIPGVLRMGQEINQSILVGLRYAFNAAPPPPPPPRPAPVAAPAPGARAHLPGVLRLGQGRPDRPRARRSSRRRRRTLRACRSRGSR